MIQTDLQTSDFYYDLPQDRIAQTPIEPRDASRLMVLHCKEHKIEHRIFRDIREYLTPSDVLVVNNSRVIPARLFGKRLPGGGACEILLLRSRSLDTWEVLTRPGRHCKVGAEIELGDGSLHAVVTEVIEDGNRIVRFSYPEGRYANLFDAFHEIGTMPLPPYITERLKDPERYQTVYAKTEGSAAAPTAGLHFTPELMDSIRSDGTAIAEVMLHVGLGTFRPVKEKRIQDHIMHSEYYELSEPTAAMINQRRESGGRIISVGTTSCRVLESTADAEGRLHAASGETDIFIYPGYRFHAVDALITNFHLPESTLLMLVSALAGKDFILEAYREAVAEKYRFFSFGDAMLILP